MSQQHSYIQHIQHMHFAFRINIRIGNTLFSLETGITARNIGQDYGTHRSFGFERWDQGKLEMGGSTRIMTSLLIWGLGFCI